MAKSGYSAGNLSLDLEALSGSAIKSLDTVLIKLKSINANIKSVSRSIQTINGKSSTRIAKSGVGFSSTKSNGKSGTLGLSDKASNLLWSLGKLRIATLFAKQLGRALSDVYQYAVDYTETLNMWQVAMRNNIDLADSFVEKMNNSYGVSRQALMHYQATFKNMLSSLGSLTEEVSYKISESLTSMALDFSSLYNVTIENAMNKFQAVLSGQVRPIRSISGYDITENTIFELYRSLGGTKTMRQLSQTEKRLLRILAVFNQMSESGALGDMAKTINQSANQMRIMSELGKEIMTWGGMFLKMVLDQYNVFVKINSVLYAVRDLLRDILYSLGYEDPDFLGGMLENAESTNEEIDKMQNKLLGFDKFRSLSGGEEDNLAIDSVVFNALAEYRSKLDSVNNLAREQADIWLEAIGYTRNANGQLVANEQTIGEIIKKVKTLATEFGDVLKIALAIYSPAMAIAAFLANEVKNGTELGNTIKGALNSILGAVKELLPYINDFINDLSPVLEGLIPVIIDIVKAVVPLITKLLPIIGKLLSSITPIIPTIAEAIEKLSPLLVTVVGAVTQLLDVLMPIVDLLLTVVNDVLKGALPLIESVSTYLSSLISATLPPLKDFIGMLSGIFGELLPSVASYLNIIFGVISKIVDALSPIANTVMPMIIKVLTNGLLPVLKTITAIIGTIVDALTALSKFNFDNLGEIIKDRWTGKNGVSNSWSNAWAKFKGSKLNPVNWFADGGLPDKGTLFVAGEAGAEIVANMGNGQSAVMNMEQLQLAITKGMMSAIKYSASGNNVDNININIDGELVFSAMRTSANRKGLDFARV